MKVKDYYKILGVARTSSTAEIKAAYYALVRKYHPDRNANGAFSIETFSQLNEAYQILGNVDNRVVYQQLLYRKDEKIEEAKSRLNSKNNNA